MAKVGKTSPTTKATLVNVGFIIAPCYCYYVSNESTPIYLMGLAKTATIYTGVQDTVLFIAI
jgi:hypothetical protein